MTLKYVGPVGRYYPRLGLTPTPGQTYRLDSDPSDGCWVTTEDAPTATKEVKNA